MSRKLIAERKQFFFTWKKDDPTKREELLAKPKSLSMFKPGRLQVITFFYTLALLTFTVYWSFYYHSFATKKGDELFTTLTILLLITYFYFIVLQFAIKRTNWAIALLLPVLNTIISFLITVVILWLAEFDGKPKEVILIFGIVFTLVSGMEGLVLWGKN